MGIAMGTGLRSGPLPVGPIQGRPGVLRPPPRAVPHRAPAENQLFVPDGAEALRGARELHSRRRLSHRPSKYENEYSSAAVITKTNPPTLLVQIQSRLNPLLVQFWSSFSAVFVEFQSSFWSSFSIWTKNRLKLK